MLDTKTLSGRQTNRHTGDRRVGRTSGGMPKKCRKGSEMADRGGFLRKTTGITRQKFSVRWVLLILTTVLFLGLFTSSAFAFTDVSGGHAYATAIDDLSTRGIINGYDDGSFRPGNPVWRQHFAKMIVLTLDIPVSEADVCPFGDVTRGGASTLYPDNFIAVAAARGITNGTGPGTFAPMADISRAQVVTMVVRAVQNILPGTLGTPPSGYQNTWGSGFSPIHGPNARVAEHNGLLTGLPVGSLDPWGKMPRGEVAQVLHNLLGLMEGGPAGPALEIVSVHADAAGNDNDNLNDEYIVFKMLVGGSLIGYSVEDDAAHTYYFPDRVFQTGQSFTLHTGSGADSQSDLYWGNGAAIWNNDGDTVKVLDPQGYVVASKGY